MKLCCLGFHKWSKWVDNKTHRMGQVHMNDVGKIESKVFTHDELEQQKRCEHCNILKARRVKL